MSIELVGLAYDQKQTEQVWEINTIEEVFDLILEDDFRQRIDLRSLLYHKGMLDLLSELELMLKQGGKKRTLIDFLAWRFKAGVELFPTPSGELLFDYKVIRQFSSLAMVDDFVSAEASLRALLHRVGYVKDVSGWSLLETHDFEWILKGLSELKLKDIYEIKEKLEKSGIKIELDRFIRTYIEFLNYAKNNRFTPFFYNNQSDLRRWGSLLARKNSRGEQIVSQSLQGKKKEKKLPKKIAKKKEDSFVDRAKRHRALDELFEGLKDPDVLIRQKSAESLSKLMEEDRLDRVKEFLKDGETDVRKELVRAVASVGDSNSEQILLDTLLNDESLEVQVISGYYLYKMGSKRALTPFMGKVRQGLPCFASFLSRHEAIQSDKKTQQELIELATSDQNKVRKDVAYVLGNIRTTASKRVLESMVEDPDDHVKMNALYSLAALKDRTAVEVAKKFEKTAHEGLQIAGTVVRTWLQE